MRANISTNARAAASSYALSRAIAVCSAHTDRCLVRRYRRVRHQPAVRFKRTLGARRMTAVIRPGIRRPDWSAVTRPAAREALLARDRSRIGLAERWNHTLEPAQDRVWQTVLELFARSGKPPRLYEIS